MDEIRVEEGEVPCRDPECPGPAEIERDGEHVYYECQECGYTFGYQRVAITDGSCALGVPEGVRQAASVADRQQPQPQLLRLGVRP